jgi:hypothetical protein
MGLSASKMGQADKRVRNRDIQKGVGEMKITGRSGREVID